MRIFLFCPVLFCITSLFAQDEPYLSNQTYTYEQALDEYNRLAEKYPRYCQLNQYGSSDYGLPVSLFLINKSGKFHPRGLAEKSVLLINNAIHPGEPEGVDASIKLSKDLLADTASLPENVIIAIIPIYNIGGAHNRNCCTRANQDGPVEYGFRGNAKNLDLNRDFIKADSKNTLAFYTIFRLLNPDVFIDTHTSNGADYQYVMTLITSQLQKMNPVLAEYVEKEMQPELYKQMEKKGFPMVPYVHTVNDIPDDGIVDFMETPRYSTGYTNLFNTIGFVAETHMLKPFDQRVEATYDLLMTTIEFMEKNHGELKEIRRQANEQLNATETFALNWEPDTSRKTMIPFLGYEAEYRISEVTGQQRLYYNHAKPFKHDIPYYNFYRATHEVKRPEFYVIPQAWDMIIPKMAASGVKVYRLKQEVELEVEQYTVIRFETVSGPYEGHYLHYRVEVDKDTLVMNYRKGDYIIPTRNLQARFIIETLEPHAVDSYLAWNYFDAVLQQKEWFSAYVFEDEAKQVLDENPGLKAELEERKKNDPEFASSSFAQLYFVYKHTAHYEPTHNRYPVTRCMQPFNPEIVEELISRY